MGKLLELMFRKTRVLVSFIIILFSSLLFGFAIWFLDNLFRQFRIANDRGLRRGAAPDALGSRASALSLHGGGERRLGDAEIDRYQGLRAGRRQILPRETR